MVGAFGLFAWWVRKRSNRLRKMESSLERLSKAFLVQRNQGRETDRLMLDVMRRAHFANATGDRVALNRMVIDELAPLREELWREAGRPKVSGRERVERLLAGEDLSGEKG